MEALSCAGSTAAIGRRRAARRARALLAGLGAVLCALAGARSAIASTESEYEVCVDVTGDIRALGSEDAFEWEPASDRLSALGAAAWPVLLRALETEGPAVREGVVGVLASGTEADDSVLRGLGRAARSDSSDTVRADAVRALRKLGGARSADVVVAALGDANPAVRHTAITACKGICTSDAALARLLELALSDEPLPNALQAQRVLAAAASEPNGGVIATRLRSDTKTALETRRASGDAADRSALLGALLLAQLEDRSRLDLLVRATEPAHPSALRVHAVHAIGRLGTAEHVPLLTELLRDDAASIYAYDALRRMAARGVAGAADAAATYQGVRPPEPLPRP